VFYFFVIISQEEYTQASENALSSIKCKVRRTREEEEEEKGIFLYGPIISTILGGVVWYVTRRKDYFLRLARAAPATPAIPAAGINKSPASG
jgi:hypothetical protein